MECLFLLFLSSVLCVRHFFLSCVFDECYIWMWLLCMLSKDLQSCRKFYHQVYGICTPKNLRIEILNNKRNERKFTHKQQVVIHTEEGSRNRSKVEKYQAFFFLSFSVTLYFPRMCQKKPFVRLISFEITKKRTFSIIEHFMCIQFYRIIINVK